MTLIKIIDNESGHIHRTRTENVDRFERYIKDSHRPLRGDPVLGESTNVMFCKRLGFPSIKGDAIVILAESCTDITVMTSVAENWVSTIERHELNENPCVYLVTTTPVEAAMQKSIYASLTPLGIQYIPTDLDTTEDKCSKARQLLGSIAADTNKIKLSMASKAKSQFTTRRVRFGGFFQSPAPAFGLAGCGSAVRLFYENTIEYLGNPEVQDNPITLSKEIMEGHGTVLVLNVNSRREAEAQISQIPANVMIAHIVVLGEAAEVTCDLINAAHRNMSSIIGHKMLDDQGWRYPGYERAIAHISEKQTDKRPPIIAVEKLKRYASSWQSPKADPVAAGAAEPEETTVPEAFICPISHEIMRDPVIDLDGNSYERLSITEWLRTQNTSPMNRKALRADQLVPNRALLEVIEDFLDKHPEHRPPDQAAGGGPAPCRTRNSN